MRLPPFEIRNWYIGPSGATVSAALGQVCWFDEMHAPLVLDALLTNFICADVGTHKAMHNLLHRNSLITVNLLAIVDSDHVTPRDTDAAHGVRAYCCDGVSLYWYALV